MTPEKKAFLRHQFVDFFSDVKGKEIGKWGKMNSQQMIEHLSAFFKVSTGKILFPLTTSIEHLPKYKNFLNSDKEFRENTKAPVLPEEPLPLHYPTMQKAFEELEKSVDDFFDFFKDDNSKQHCILPLANSILMNGCNCIISM